MDKSVTKLLSGEYNPELLDSHQKGFKVRMDDFRLNLQSFMDFIFFSEDWKARVIRLQQEKIKELGTTINKLQESVADQNRMLRLEDRITRLRDSLNTFDPPAIEAAKVYEAIDLTKKNIIRTVDDFRLYIGLPIIGGEEGMRLVDTLEFNVDTDEQ